MNFYVDGAITSKTIWRDNLASQTLISTSPFYIAQRSDGMCFPGSLDEFSVWDKALSALEVAEVYNGGRLPVDLTTVSCAANLLAWLPMGERDTFPTLTDRSGNGYNGTMTNMEATDIQDRSVDALLAFSKKSLVFDGVDEYVTMGDVLGFERTDAFSVSLWVKTTQTGVDTALFCKTGDSSDYRGYLLNQSATGDGLWFFLCSVCPTNCIEVRTTRTINDGKWHHVVVTYSGSSTAAGVLIYIDGGAVPTTTAEDTLTGTILTTNPFYLASRATSGLPQPFAGFLDEVSIWDKELSAVEVDAIYNQGVPSDLSGTPNLAGYWRLGDSIPNSGTMTNMSAGSIVEDAPAGARSQRRGRHSGGTPTGQGQTISPMSSSGESYVAPGALQHDDSSIPAQRRGLNSTLSPTGQGQTEMPMSGQGESYGFRTATPSGGSIPSYSPSTVRVLHEGGETITWYYRMRAWNLVTLTFEVWVSVGSPDPSPPSGNPVIGVTVIGVWEE
jgi:hypothetical protein